MKGEGYREGEPIWDDYHSLHKPTVDSETVRISFQKTGNSDRGGRSKKKGGKLWFRVGSLGQGEVSRGQWAEIKDCYGVKLLGGCWGGVFHRKEKISGGGGRGKECEKACLTDC